MKESTTGGQNINGETDALSLGAVAAKQTPRGTKRIAKIFTCPHCGRQHIGKTKYCPYCGMEMKIKVIVNGRAVRANNDKSAVQFTLLHKIVALVAVLLIAIGVSSVFVIENARGNYSPQKLLAGYVKSVNENDNYALAEALYPKNSPEYIKLLETLPDTGAGQIRRRITVTEPAVEEGPRYCLVTATVEYIVTETDAEGNVSEIQNDTYPDQTFHMMKKGTRWYFTSMPSQTGNEKPASFTLGEVYTVAFDTLGAGTLAEQYVPTEDGYLQPVDETLLVKDGKYFAGWYSDPDYKMPFAFSSKVASDMTLYALWVDDGTTYQISFVTNQDGYTVPAQTVKVGGTVSAPSLYAAKNLVFDGWFADSSFTKVYDFDIEVAGNLTLYAKWSEVSFVYSYDTNKGGYYITGIASGDPTWIVFPSKHSDDKPVVGINTAAFAEKKSLQTVEIPDSIKYIGEKAFSNCTNLKLIEGCRGVEIVGFKAFDGTPWYEQAAQEAAALDAVDEKYGLVIIGKALYKCVEVPQSGVIITPLNVVSITDEAFADLDKLSQIVIKSEVETIGSRAFKNCVNLRTVTLSAKTVNGEAFLNCIWLDKVNGFEKVTVMGDGIFSGCEKLTFVELNPELKSLPSRTFLNCAKLDEVILPSGLEKIGDSAFSGCKLLKNLGNSNELPASLSTIEARAFKNCTSLTNIKFSSVKTVRDEVFYGCEALVEVTGFNQVTSIGYGIFNGCSELTAVSLNDKLTSIPRETFQNCSKLVNITLPSALTTIDKSAFSGCASLERVVLPSGLTNIGESAFSGCISLLGIGNDGKLPAKVSAIGANAFKDCRKLSFVYLHKDIRTIGSNAFGGCSAITIMCELTEGQKPSGWASDFLGNPKAHIEWKPAE